MRPALAFRNPAARRSLAAEASAAYELIVLDAFSSDAIPVHLITREAFLLYRSRLAPGGALLAHFSNRDLELEPVLGRVAKELGLAARVRHDPVPRFTDGGKLSSEWIAMAQDEAALGRLAVDGRWYQPSVPAGSPLWTDDHANPLGVLRYARSR
jgi:hypothetical protein